MQNCIPTSPKMKSEEAIKQADVVLPFQMGKKSNNYKMAQILKVFRNDAVRKLSKTDTQYVLELRSEYTGSRVEHFSFQIYQGWLNIILI